ncbi:MAG: hypothetical protein ACLFTI_07000 [Anaerolineales bacterium]
MRNNPYVGPRPYERQDRQNFYGRDLETRELLSLILSAREVLFYAESGAGKTSLLNAKIIPELEQETFDVLPVARVGNAPPPHLAPGKIENIFVFSVLLSLAPDTPPEDLCQHTLRSYLESISDPENDQLPLPILILDQFEELFTTHRDRWPDVRGFFLQVREALDELPQLGVIFVMREDYVASMDAYAPLLPHRLRARFRMRRLGEQGALQAVKRPAESAGCVYEPGVAERLVADLRQIKVAVTAEAGAEDGAGEEAILGPEVEPVQLQVICHRLWENLPEQEDQAIQWEEVEQYGDIDRALMDFYEDAVRAAVETTAVHEREVRRWFGQQLITSMGTRGLAMRGAEETAHLSNAAVDVLADQHIIRSDMRAGARWYELVHDRLIDPILQSNQAWEAQRETPLRVVARRWKETGNEALLYQGAMLAEAIAWLAAHLDEAEDYEREFIAASETQEEHEARIRKLKLLAAGIGVATLLIVAFLGWMAARSSLIAQISDTASRSQQMLQSNRLASIRLAREGAREKSIYEALGLAFSQSPFGEVKTTKAEIALRRALLDYYPVTVYRHPYAQVYDVTYSARGRYIYALSPDDGIWAWDTAMQRDRIISWPQRGGIWALAAHPAAFRLAVGGDAVETDAAQMVTAGSAGRASNLGIWDDESQAWRQWLRMPRQTNLYSLAFDPTGRYLIGGGHYDAQNDDVIIEGGIVYIWQASEINPEILHTTPALTLTTGATERVNEIAYGEIATQRYIAAASDDAIVYVWELHPLDMGGTSQLTATLHTTFTGHTGPVNAVAFSPAENILASASQDRTIRFWDLETGRAVHTLVGHTAGVTTIAYSSDGTHLVSGSRDLTVRLWNIATRAANALTVLSGPENVVLRVGFSPEDRYILAGSGDKSVRLWDRSFLKEQQLSTLTGQTARMRNIAFNPQGKFLASGDDQGIAQVWSLASGEVINTLHTLGGTLWDVTYSHDGQQLITCSEDGKVRVWEAATGHLIKVLSGHRADVNVSAFSPDGAYLATGSDDQTAILWDTESWRPAQVLTLPGYPGRVYTLDYSPDGRLVATGHTDHNIRLWELAPTDEGVLSLSRVVTLSAHTDALFRVAFSPDGRYLASASWDNTARLWDMETLTAVHTLEHGSFVYSVAFDPTGRYLATGARDATVRLWDLSDLSKRPRQAPGIIGVYPGHNDLVWDVAFSPDGDFLASSSWDQTIRRYLVNFEDVWALSDIYLEGELSAPPE